MCITRTPYDVSISGTVTTTTTGEPIETCATIYGCAVEDISATESVTQTTTATATATPLPHVIYPMNSNDNSETGALEEELNNLVEGEEGIYTAKKDPFGVLFWRATITTEQADELSKRDDVSTPFLISVFLVNHYQGCVRLRGLR